MSSADTTPHLLFVDTNMGAELQNSGCQQHVSPLERHVDRQNSVESCSGSSFNSAMALIAAITLSRPHGSHPTRSGIHVKNLATITGISGIPTSIRQKLSTAPYMFNVAYIASAIGSVGDPSQSTASLPSHDSVLRSGFRAHTAANVAGSWISRAYIQSWPATR